MAVVRALILSAAMAHGVNPDFMLQVAQCESGFDVRAVSPDGENFGLYQLRIGGKLDVFYGDGYTDWADPAQQANFFAEQVRAGQTWAWTCAGYTRAPALLQ